MDDLYSPESTAAPTPSEKAMSFALGVFIAVVVAALLTCLLP